MTKPTAPAHRLRLVVGFCALAIVVLDQATKWWAETTLVLREYHPLLGDLLGWRLVYNPGAAFGLAADYTWVLTIFAGVAVVGFSHFRPAQHQCCLGHRNCLACWEEPSAI